jgi:hypothetical protein
MHLHLHYPLISLLFIPIVSLLAFVFYLILSLVLLVKLLIGDESHDLTKGGLIIISSMPFPTP